MEPNDITRRDFLKSVGLAAAAATFGCASTGTKEAATLVTPSKPVEPIIYPRLPGNKVQAPENGCMVGFHKVFVPDNDPKYISRGMEIANKSRNIDDFVKLYKQSGIAESVDTEGMIAKQIKEYEQKLGAKPFMYVIYYRSRLYLDFPMKEAVTVAKSGVTPYINALPGFPLRASLGLGLSEIASGKRDNYITKYAEGAAEFAKNHGPFFWTTMEEMNGYWYYWGQNSNFIPAWRHIWQIFEDQGVNQYATWVWEASTTEPHRRRPIHDPEMYYPGDKYVDWIGLSAFSRKGLDSDAMTFGGLVGNTYQQMFKNHKDKPIMQAEFGKSQDWNQPRWLTDAYKSIITMPGMKAAIYWDNVTTQIGDDKTLSQKSLDTLKEIFKDPYWIMAK